MSKKLYVGNLPFSVTQERLRELFSAYNVSEAIILIDKYSGKSKGFGFVTIDDDSEADKAVSEMNGKEVEGRQIVVNEARPFDPDRPRKPRFERGGFDRSSGRGGFGGNRRFGRRDNRNEGSYNRRSKNEDTEDNENSEEGENY